MPTTPDYIRIADDVVSAVHANKLKPGDRLPSIAQLALDNSVGTTTIQMAYVRLEALRVIRRHQGKGVFVNDPRLWMREP
ncbi:GntR family transcriptional regulator [Micromonospora rosaria]|uniref:GntR family transcriptional regulator n=1 Tax=Micromonospora rosaria TaxID=47874 RepID=A0A136PLS5_9ACTN|nr:winged helix-turn-helix domain-containing protein [Micromonospora rosaria]KXK59323.1 GntR family transcriptional regulator [Micromonospora rosaria]